MSGEEVSKKVYDNLLKYTENSLKTLHEYVAERKKILELNQMHMYDMYVSLVGEYKIEKPYEQAYEMVKKGLSVLGEENQSILQSACVNGWIDVEETYGKRSGAYSVGVYGLKHPYVLLNYSQTTHDIFTIAHELGHAMTHQAKMKDADRKLPHGDRNKKRLEEEAKKFETLIRNRCHEK